MFRLIRAPGSGRSSAASTEGIKRGRDVCETQSFQALRPGVLGFHFHSQEFYLKVCSAQPVKSVESERREVLFSAKNRSERVMKRCLLPPPLTTTTPTGEGGRGGVESIADEHKLQHRRTQRRKKRAGDIWR